MATVQAPQELSHSVPAHSSTVPAAPKLRDSCHACAISKVKCNKEKPKCARCAKKGMACQYHVTKRAGRKHETRPRDPINATQIMPESNLPSTSEAGLSASPNFFQPSLHQQRNPSSFPDLLPNLLSSADPTSTPTPTSFGADFEDIFGTPISFTFPDPSSSDMLSQPHDDSRDIHSGLLDVNGATRLAVSDNAFMGIDEAIAEYTTPHQNSQSSTNGGPQTFQACHAQSPCCCLVSALSHFKQLFPNAPPACTVSSEQGRDNVVENVQTIQSVIADNQQALEAISNMLQCPCSQDGYVLAIMSLIVFKVLGWYAAAVRDVPASGDGQSPSKPFPTDRHNSSSYHSEQVLHFPTVVGKYCIDGEDQGRMAAQLVLSELHRVQRLLNQLSQRLKTHGSRKRGLETPDSVADGLAALSDGEVASAFSASMMDQIEMDLRKRLRTLSLEIVDTLRRG
ncbi:MAG: hypothetical protein Q9190_000447 [Brigantiaea leucoxantha]